MTDRLHGRIPGLRGSLLSQDALADVIPDRLRGLLDENGRAPARRRLRAWHLPLRSLLGPATSPRAMLDTLAVPLFAQLGYRVLPDAQPSRRPRTPACTLTVDGRIVAVLVVTHWGDDTGGAWRDAVHHGIAHGARWCCCVTGPSLRIVDCVRTYSRQFVELDLEIAFDDERTFAVLWGLLRGPAMAGALPGGSPLLERAIAISEDYRAAVRLSLQSGVDTALLHLHGAFAKAGAARRRHPPDRLGQLAFDEALVVIYRVLFLLFAEARGLVPRWHPIIRDGYTIEALRQPIETLPRPRGLWETLQSIARLAHRGCRIGALRVTPFNGRLFSPLESPLADSVPLDDGVVRQALLALTTRRARGGRQRIAYGDLGVEQLGGVYERVLDIEPVTATSDPAVRARVRRSERRKSTGSFYTPRALTEFLVRRTLAPLVADASPDAILSLKILDPAMGSGAFLVAACRYLASAYEAAVIRDEGVAGGELDERDRADFRRRVAQQCLFGVDVNPMAVQLGRLSLWLATLAADRPLTFLDHRLRAGNSLVGAGPADLARQPPGRANARRKRPAVLPLFEDPADDAGIASALAIRNAIASEPGDTLAQVRAKEQALARLAGSGSLVRWKTACDAWCSVLVPCGLSKVLAASVRTARGCDLRTRHAAAARVHTGVGRRARDRGRTGVLPLAVRVPGGVPDRGHAGIRRRHRQPAVGDAPGRSRRRGRSKGGTRFRRSPDRLRAKLGRLHAAGRRTRQSLSDVPGAQCVARAAPREDRPHPPVRARVGSRGVAAQATPVRADGRGHLRHASRTATESSRFIAV